MSRWSSFDKRVELVTKAAHYLNRMNELNSTCNKKHNERKRRQIDSAMITLTDFGFKKLRENILSKRINELKDLNTEKVNPKSNGEYCF